MTFIHLLIDSYKVIDGTTHTPKDIQIIPLNKKLIDFKNIPS